MSALPKVICPDCGLEVQTYRKTCGKESTLYIGFHRSKSDPNQRCSGVDKVVKNSSTEPGCCIISHELYLS